jgi:hypothetical protein
MGIKHFRFIENPKHLFECYTPPTPDEIVWKQHPVFEHLWASNAGFVECRDDYNVLVRGSLSDARGETYSYIAKAEENCEGRFLIRGGPKHPKRYPGWQRLILECFQGVQHKNKRLMRLNHNPWDNRPENLAYYFELDSFKGWLDSQQQFIDNTNQQLLMREQLLPDDMNMEEYFSDVLFIPHEFMHYYRKFKKKLDI